MTITMHYHVGVNSHFSRSFLVIPTSDGIPESDVDFAKGYFPESGRCALLFVV